MAFEFNTGCAFQWNIYKGQNELNSNRQYNFETICLIEFSNMSTALTVTRSQANGYAKAETPILWPPDAKN